MTSSFYRYAEPSEAGASRTSFQYYAESADYATTSDVVRADGAAAYSDYRREATSERVSDHCCLDVDATSTRDQNYHSKIADSGS